MCVAGVLVRRYRGIAAQSAMEHIRVLLCDWAASGTQPTPDLALIDAIIAENNVNFRGLVPVLQRTRELCALSQVSVSSSVLLAVSFACMPMVAHLWDGRQCCVNATLGCRACLNTSLSCVPGCSRRVPRPNMLSAAIAARSPAMLQYILDTLTYMCPHSWVCARAVSVQVVCLSTCCFRAGEVAQATADAVEATAVALGEVDMYAQYLRHRNAECTRACHARKPHLQVCRCALRLR